jgi:tetratricopeptide (TPR) repeat protein
MRNPTKGARTALKVRSVARACGTIALAAVALLLVFKVSMAGVLVNANPPFVLAWAPFDAQARANWAAVLLTAGRPTSEVRAAAEAAIRRDPTRVVAYRTLALAADRDGDSARALFYADLANRVSRRDQPTQVWLVGHFLRQGDFARGVRHLDIALTTSDRSRHLLFPLMASSMIDRRMQSLLRETLARRPEWWLPFLAYAADNASDLPAAAALAAGLLDPAVREQRAVIATLLQRLAESGEFDAAGALFARSVGTPAFGMVRDGGFQADPALPPFDWQLMHDDDLTAVRQSRPDSAGGSALSLIASGGRSGTVARQLLRLPAGTYRLGAEVGAIPADLSDRPTLRVACAEAPTEAAPLVALRPERSGTEGQRIGGAFTVPTRCAWQWLSVSLSGDGPQSDISPWIDNIAIMRAGSRPVPPGARATP